MTEAAARDWRRGWVENRQAPELAHECWATVRENFDCSIADIRENQMLAGALLQLAAIADECCEDFGSPQTAVRDSLGQRFRDQADELLQGDHFGVSTLCDEIHPSRGLVLPKMHTPTSGLTIRSLSLYLCFCTRSEIRPQWVLAGGLPERAGLNLLVVPWPFSLAPKQFVEVPPLPGEMTNMPDEFGFFSFRHSTPEGEAVGTLTALFEKAQDEMGAIDGVILPELAISSKEHLQIRKFVSEPNAFLVAGVGIDPDSQTVYGTNEACLDIPYQHPLRQQKHHRWKLDRSQIRQYGLGSKLSPSRQFWEHIDISDRRLIFAALQPSLVMSVLICKDLARPDPVGDLVRAVGPNLVIALLMDGPQLRARWPGRYAMSLADDPGCSVLSVTSLGMSKMSRPLDGSPDRSRTVALWKDATQPAAVELDLPQGCDALVLSLSTEYREEWTADGRSDGGAAGYPTLSGVHGVRL